jgi:3-deoxy-manno-octulosonate cytidylyltransferase (CMP-KDO synthetase)
MGSSVVAIIPARFESTRLPGKPLAEIGGKPMIQRVFERARQAAGIDRVLVATDSERIADVVRGFGGEAVMTRPTHTSGTDRIAEVAAQLDADIIVNIQGDLPFLDQGMAQSATRLLQDDPHLPMATIKSAIREPAAMHNPNVVKVVTDADGYALYFSRSPLPFWRDGEAPAVVGYKHIGLYAYRRDFLLQLTKLAPTPLERAEKLEQLRVLESGFRIRVAETTESVGVEVDTPEDLARARAAAS